MDDDPDHQYQMFMCSVDGVHFRVNEPTHPTYSKNPTMYSHKFHQAALNYEIAISIFTQQVIWINGPKKASTHDITIFREPNGLKEKMPQGKLVIGDKGYRGEKQMISTPNSHEPDELRKFKSRARARQETFNARLKTFASLDRRFRHGLQKHKTTFEAVCVICQYQMENGSPLFEI